MLQVEQEVCLHQGTLLESQMPLTVQDGAVLGAGMWAAALATVYFKKKQTLPFKVCLLRLARSPLYCIPLPLMRQEQPFAMVRLHDL